MFTSSQLLSATPVGSQVASSDSSSGPSLIIIALIVIGVIWFITYLIGSVPTVVVVQKDSGSSFLWFLVISVAIAILFLVYVVPGSGPI
jgi:preprotein translocase subunit SecY